LVVISSNNLQEYPRTVRSIEEASRLLAEAAEHKKLSYIFKTLAALQLERAQNEARLADSQFDTAEEYMCSIVHMIVSSGFTIDSIGSHSATVAKVDGSKFCTISSMYIMYSIYLLL
jgi:hypothetical protein